MKKIVFLSLVLIFLIPFGHAFANDTDLYILTQLMQQVPPDALLLRDLSGSMSNYPTDQSTYTLYINPGTTTTCQYNCGGTGVAYYTTSSGNNTSSCTGISTLYASSKSNCTSSTFKGPFYQSSGSGHGTLCTSSNTSTLYYNGNCTTTNEYSCGNTTIPYYTTNASPNTTPCTIQSTTVVYGNSNAYGDPACTGPFYLTNTCGSSACNTVCTQSKAAISDRAFFELMDADNGTGTGTPDGIINSYDQAYLKIRMGYMRYYGCGVYQSCSKSSSSPLVPENVVPVANWSNPPAANPAAGYCNTLIDPINTPYYQIYCKSSTSCTPSGPATAISVETETPSGGTPIGPALQDASNYLQYTKSQDVDAACRQKFVIFITDGDDTMACPGNCTKVYQDGTETNQYQYMGRRETVAQARALANQGFYLFVIGFGSTMPVYQQNTLNWAAYYGNPTTSKINTGVPQSITTMYTIPTGMLYPTGITKPCQTSTTTTSCNNGENYCATANDPGEDNISGYAFIAQDESQLSAAINSIRNFIIQLVQTSTSYVAPVVPISQYQSTSSENSMYLGMFEPTNTTMWNGNIKKYGIVSTATSTLSVGEIVDENGKLAIEPNSSSIVTTAESYWSTSVDGGNVTAGGVGALLQASNLNSRKIYTYLGTNTDLTTSSNAFSTSNTLITPALLGVSTTTVANNIVNFVYGWDVWSWNTTGNSGPSYPRQWILGSFIHSRPTVIHYGTQDVIYAGSNDGMLHAFDNASGNELWAFIPPDLLPNLQNFNNGLTSLQIFVDGAPNAYVTYTYNSNGSINSVTQAILIFGERRGGNTYTALDVTNPSDPKFLWSISPTTTWYQTTKTASTAYGEMGESWSTPILGQIKNGSATKEVVFIAGGYDATHEDTTPAGTDSCGRAVYVVDVLTGSQIWKYSVSNNTNMTYCIPSDITALSSNADGFIERLYVGDVGGQMWRFDLCSSTTGTCVPDMSSTANWTGKRIFIAGSTGTPGSQKIFYPPDVTFELNLGKGTYDMLFFGTGDREKPNDTSVINSLYALKDYDNDTNPPTPLPITISNLVNVTSDVLQSSSATQAQKAAVLASLESENGWYITLNESAGESQNPGEKCDAPAVVISGTVYFTTFTPTPVNTQSVCTIGTGESATYPLNYQTGNAVFDLNQDGQITVADRSMQNVGAGIPSGIVITVINGTVTAYGGVAGGVFTPQLTNTNSIVPLDWRIVF